MNLLNMDFRKKIALAVSIAALAVLVTVGVCLSSRSSDGIDALESERIETEILRQNDLLISDDIEIDIAEADDQIDYEPNYIEDDTLNPPYAEDEEVLDILPARPGFLHPVYGDEPEVATDPAEETTGTEGTTYAETEAPETEDVPEISPEAPPAVPVVETTTTKQTTQTKPETEAEPEIAIPEGSNLRAAMVAVAKSQLGVTEKAYNNVKYNTWYYGYTVSDKKGGTKYAWCGAFLAWCADQAGVPQSVFPRTASVSGLKSFFSNQGRYYKAKSYTPKTGDIVFFSYSHVGVVVSVADGILTTIEGNASDSVKMNTYKISDSHLAGYGSPKY